MDFVWNLAFYLNLSTKDLVVAFVILERCFSAGQAIVLRPHTARKLFLASCTIARKFSTDERLFNRDATKSLAQAFTALDMEHLQALERQARHPTHPDSRLPCLLTFLSLALAFPPIYFPSQVLKLMRYSLPIDVGFYQMYADALNAAANTSTGAQRVAPDMQAE